VLCWVGSCDARAVGLRGGRAAEGGIGVGGRHSDDGAYGGEAWCVGCNMGIVGGF